MLNNYSPVNQDFIWLAEYLDGTHVAEYDLTTKEYTNFYKINRQNLLRFGLIGHGLKLCFDCSGGTFKINTDEYNIRYHIKDSNDIIPLTGGFHSYTDVITYKDAHADINLRTMTRGLTNKITQFNYGYKTKIKHKDLNINFKAIVGIPLGKPAFMDIRLVSDKELDGELIIAKNGQKVFSIEAPLNINQGGELRWNII